MVPPHTGSKGLSRTAALGGIVAACILVLAQRPLWAGAVQHTVLHSFGGSDGAGPETGVLIDKSGAFYGATLFGGTGAGTVYKLTPGKSGYTESTIYNFRGGADGSVPWGIVADKSGSLYGVTFLGGDPGNGGVGWGTVFKLVPGQSGYTKSTLYRFTSSQDGYEPVGAPVLGQDGSIYGVTSLGGLSNNGTVFKLAPSNSGYTKSMLYAFPGNSGGSLPAAGLTIDQHGTLYGTTSSGGFIKIGPCDGGCGTVFQITSENTGYRESVLYRFTGADGSDPSAALTIDRRSGDIFGTTIYGGADLNGSVFKLTRSGSGYVERVLYSFTGNADGFLPQGQLWLAADGALYGTVSLGGGGCRGIGCGVVFGLTPAGSGYSFKVIYDFRYPKNGAEPQGSSIVADPSGALYGTTRSGGLKSNCADGGPGGVTGCGTECNFVR